jgi:hypothetical protein
MEFDLSDLLKEAYSLEERIVSLTPRKHDQSFRSSINNAAMVHEVPELKPLDATSASGNVGFYQPKAPSFESQTVARSLDPGVDFSLICKSTAQNIKNTDSCSFVCAVFSTSNIDESLMLQTASSDLPQADFVAKERKGEIFSALFKYHFSYFCCLISFSVLMALLLKQNREFSRKSSTSLSIACCQ